MPHAHGPAPDVEVAGHKTCPDRSTFSAGVANVQVAGHRAASGAGGNRYAVAGHEMVEVVVVPAMDSSVTRSGTS